MSPSHNEPIAIVGNACRFPGDATSPSKLWELLKEPREVARPIDRFAASSFYHQNGHYHGASNVRDAYLLSEDPRYFDAQFFNIPTSEADSIDPQQRTVLETVYEAVESSGLVLEDLRGSDTAVYVGVMCDDYGNICYVDQEAVPTYAATGTARSMIIHSGANRSFFSTYDQVQAINVQSTKELPLMSAASLRDHRRVVPFHFLSGTEAATIEHASDGSEGYVASKWASERFLGKYSDQLRFPVHVHRQLPVPEGHEAQGEELD
ncbi:hypothetical protein N7451_008219 [Penicillium sp. IBT 35674x]|nr:hypothetical protein N7451_008219 [Penicillium sp. IBT 35674x]